MYLDDEDPTTMSDDGKAFLAVLALGAMILAFALIGFYTVCHDLIVAAMRYISQ